MSVCPEAIVPCQVILFARPRFHFWIVGTDIPLCVSNACIGRSYLFGSRSAFAQQLVQDDRAEGGDAYSANRKVPNRQPKVHFLDSNHASADGKGDGNG